MMNDAVFKTAMQVDYINHMGSDREVVDAAKASLGQVEYEPGKEAGLIRHMMTENPPHSSVFEHCVLKVRISLPIFAHRQLMTHRTLSKNSESGRYTELRPVFWVPDYDRPLVNSGSSARPNLTHGDPDDIDSEILEHKRMAREGWRRYKESLERGTAKEVARNYLPVTTYTSVVVTGNLWAWTHFFKLRAGYGGHPQKEIQEVALRVESIFQELFPLTHEAWLKTMPAQ